MTYESVQEGTRDLDLIARVRVAIADVAFTWPAIRDTAYGLRVRLEGPDVVLDLILWRGSVAFEDQYEAAVEAGNPRPGIDPAVISDALLYDGIKLYWPPDP